jgi:GNAT superfamily N-acetyltransferase
VSIRRASASEGAAIASLQRRTWQATYRGIFPDEMLDGFDVVVTGENWANAAATPKQDCAILVAVRDDTVVGFASVAPVDDEPGVGELETLYVEPDLQRAGIGRGLHEAAVASLARSSFTEAILWVAEEKGGARAFDGSGELAMDALCGRSRGFARREPRHESPMECGEGGGSWGNHGVPPRLRSVPARG